ncbi:hypothetical protein M406DRAFT_60978 [Cryphonectria parasitica EP155]|uniref:Polyketide cyclase n=1 Tax=Cryphonectria parasitica (strain ATCC 38755 / EP155) TaxID=660469 RepID=A0A9P4Y693_CRYP1|nr:uncharacterized protein M406DRAFT_60978 [Cryphonectria parasitica EP155]KAF3766860.1 hypothetical protein M406DRAFT_60978 [Cryphonectria parasitica EP155]
MSSSNPSQSAIIWPSRFTPGLTDNFVSNERIAKGITAAQIWALLDDITKWESYYKNCQQITPPRSGESLLKKGDKFKFSTFGFPPLDCSVEESVAPGGEGAPGRLAWMADTGELQVYHAWLVEDLDGERVRILTQESQVGGVFTEMSEDKPNVMLLGHQDWLDGLVKTARGEKWERS